MFRALAQRYHDVAKAIITGMSSSLAIERMENVTREKMAIRGVFTTLRNRAVASIVHDVQRKEIERHFNVVLEMLESTYDLDRVPESKEQTLYAEAFDVDQFGALKSRIEAALELDLHVRVSSGLLAFRPITGTIEGFKLEVRKEPFFDDIERARREELESGERDE